MKNTTEHTDNYPTRVSDYFSIIMRKNDCAKSKPDFITQDQFESYKVNGFLVLKDFYNQSDILKAKNTAEDIFNGLVSCYTNKEPKINQIRSALSIHDMDGLSHLLNSKLIRIAKSFLSDSVYIHQSRINYKSGMEANGWNWHSDFETWHAKDGMPNMECFTAIIALDDNTIENGCIKFIPKSQNYFVSCPKIGDVKPEDEFSEQKEGVPSEKSINNIMLLTGTDIINVECKKGDLVLFDCNLLHSSGANTTTGKRTNVYFVFNSYSNKLVNPFSGTEHRPEEMGNTNPKLL